jgi:hypothetical protein
MVVAKKQPAGSGCRHGDPVEARRQRRRRGMERRDGAGGTETLQRRGGGSVDRGRGEEARCRQRGGGGRRNGCPVRGDVGAADWTGEGGGGAEGREEAAARYV